MSTVAEIESAIAKLSPEEQQVLLNKLLANQGAKSSVWEELRALAGTATDLPPDLAANHDHYLHGTPRRSSG